MKGWGTGLGKVWTKREDNLEKRQRERQKERERRTGEGWTEKDKRVRKVFRLS